MARRRLKGDLTVREAAKSLRLRQAEILHLADESERLDLITAYRAGNGIGAITRQGDYQIEYILDRPTRKRPEQLASARGANRHTQDGPPGFNSS